MPATARPLSVMFATTRGWPDARPTVDSLRDQVAAVGGEIVVIDGSGKPPPSADETGRVVRWIAQPGGSVFQLRHRGYREAAGEVVALTEDHCTAAPDLCEAILRAHAEHPDAIAVGGVVENGTTRHLVDWAAFIIVQGPFAAPVPNGPADRIAGVAAVSYKRRAIERFPDHGPLGTIELFDTTSIRREGETLVNDGRIRAIHYQSMGILGTAAAEYHNGRAIAGFRRRVLARSDVLRVLGFPVLPLFRAFRSIRIALGKQIPRPSLVGAIPLIVFLEYAHGAGEVLGYLSGPGDSPSRLL